MRACCPTLKRLGTRVSQAVLSPEIGVPVDSIFGEAPVGVEGVGDIASIVGVAAAESGIGIDSAGRVADGLVAMVGSEGNGEARFWAGMDVESFSGGSVAAGGIALPPKSIRINMMTSTIATSNLNRS